MIEYLFYDNADIKALSGDLRMRPSYDVVVLGDYFFDQIFTGLPSLPQLGRETYCADLHTVVGAVYTTVAALRRLGANVGWAGTFGTDQYSRFAYDQAQSEGVDLQLARHLDQPYRRVTSAMPFNGDRAFLTYCDPDTGDALDFWYSALEACDFKHVIFGGMMRLNEARPIIELAHRRGATVSMDCQDMPILETPCEVRDVLPHIDVFLPNAREVMVVAETSDIRSALERLMPLCPLIVVKDGANGAWVGHKGQIRHSPGVEAGPLLDTTGAGDCFNAGFVYGHVVEGAPLDVSARYGNICGGLSVTGVGGSSTAPTYDELMMWHSSLGVQNP